jgi:cytochrome P450
MITPNQPNRINRNHSIRNHVPKPSGFSKISSLIKYSRKPLEFSIKYAEEYGDIVCLGFGSMPIYLFNHPSLIEQVLSKQNQKFIKDISYRALTWMLGGDRGLFLLEGELWKERRQLMQTAFNSEKIAAYASTTVEHTNQMLALWQLEEIYDVHQEMSQLTIKLITQSLFDFNATETAQELSNAFNTIMLNYFHQAETLFLLPQWLPTPSNRKAHQAADCIKQIVNTIIEQCQKSPSDNFLSKMLQFQNAKERQFTYQDVQDEVITLLFAGHETTATTLTWTLMLLAQHPEVEFKLREEIQSVLQGRLPTLQDFSQLRYTEMVIKESMRLYPAAWILGREVISDCQIGNEHLKPGATIYVSPWVVHRDARFFQNPEQFCPERWQDNLEQKLPRCTYFPFGAGPRVCLGKAFAMVQVMLILTMVVQKFRLILVSNQSLELLPSIALCPQQGIKMLINKHKE